MKKFSGNKWKPVMQFIETADGSKWIEGFFLKRATEMKGGFNRKKNHLANHFNKQWLTQSEIRRLKRYLKGLEKCK